MRNLILTGGMVFGALLTAACSDSMKSALPTAPSGAASSTALASTAVSGRASISPDGTVVADETSNSTLDKGKGGNGSGGGSGSGSGSGGGNGGDNGHDDRGHGNDGDQGDDRRGPNPGPPINTSPGVPTVPTNPGNNKVEVEGLISGVAGQSIAVNGQTIVVPPTAVIRHGSTTFTFADLRVGSRVHVKATRMQDGTIQASEVKLQRPDDDDNDDDDVDDDDDDDDNNRVALVSVTAFDASASETGLDTGTFRFARSGSTASSLTVTYTLAGTASNGADFQLLSLSVTFLAGNAVADVVVTPLADGTAEGPETVILTVTDGAAYDLGSPNSATITIAG